MSQAVFPVLRGLGWSPHKIPLFSTRVSTRQSGRKVKAPNWVYPIYQFELTFNYLRTDQAYTDLQQLMGFFLQRQGQFDSFLFMDPTDNLVGSQVIGVGDGSTVLFPLIRNMGGWVEPIGQVANVPTVSVGGAPAAGWTIVQPNFVQFAAPPAIGAQIVVSNLQFYFVCEFQADSLDFENIMTNWWTVKSCKFQSVKL
jgi:uncharacterized protein (TIGR02217 family)